MQDYFLEDRLSRQRRLPEVGESGQARIRNAAFEVRGSGAAALVENAYLARAGAQQVSSSAQPAGADFPHAQHFRNEQAAEVAAGAWRALDKLRRVLGVVPG